MAVPNKDVFEPRARKGQPAKATTKPLKVGDKPGKGGKGGKGDKGGKGQRTPVVGPYDAPYMTPGEKERSARETAAGAVESVPAIERRYGVESTAAQGVTQSFQDMLARQNAQTNAALSAINAAAGGGVGSGVLASQIGGEIQGAEYAPRVAAGKGAELQAGVQAERTKALEERAQQYRNVYTKAKEDIETKEREKQAARIERAATAKLYGLKQAEFEYKQQQDAFDNAIKQQRADAYVAAASGKGTDKLIGALDTAAKAAAVGTGGRKQYTGKLSYYDTDTGKYETIDIATPLYGPTGTREQRQQFWMNYVAKQRGTVDKSKPINVSGLEGKYAAADPVSVVNTLINSLFASGDASSVQEAKAWIAQTAYGRANPKAVAAATG